MPPSHQTDPFGPNLLTGEHILWTGRPRQGLMLAARDVLLIPFSLMWGGFAIFWNAQVWFSPGLADGADLVFRLWGLPFLFVGLYMIAGRFFHDAQIRRGLVYAVTDQRVLVRRGSISPRLTSLDIRRLPRIELAERSDGSGTITFDSNSGSLLSGMNGFGWWVPSLGDSPTFLSIDQSRFVYQLIQQQSRV